MGLQSDKWYFMRGDKLIQMQVGLNKLIEDIREDHLSAPIIETRLTAIKDCIPDDPLEADF